MHLIELGSSAYHEMNLIKILELTDNFRID